jgi:hypothetical protein
MKIMTAAGAALPKSATSSPPDRRESSVVVTAPESEKPFITPPHAEGTACAPRQFSRKAHQNA